MNETATHVEESRVYDSHVILIATIFGGPLVGGYLLAENFKGFGEVNRTKQSWIWGILGLSIMISVSGIIQNAYVKMIVPVLFSVLTYIGALYFQGGKIRLHQQLGGQMHRKDRMFVICFVGAVATYLALLIASVMTQIAYTPDQM